MYLLLHTSWAASRVYIHLQKRRGIYSTVQWRGSVFQTTNTSVWHSVKEDACERNPKLVFFNLVLTRVCAATSGSWNGPRMKGFSAYASACVLVAACMRETHTPVYCDENKCQFEQRIPWS